MDSPYTVTDGPKRSYQWVEDKKCENCNQVFHPRRTPTSSSPARFCSRECQYEGLSGSNSPHWQGGRFDNGSGYLVVYQPDHPMAQNHGYVLEHRLVMERVIGRVLEPHETVHHINGDSKDNRPENLQLRTGKHGKGIAHYCGDCGSTNVISMPISERSELRG